MNHSKHRLVAVLFADIKGYSALMEEREAYAFTVLERYQDVTARFVQEYHGELIKSYGDGSLIIFNSTISAVQCAQDMQLAFRLDPVVPLRIGIHVGEVIGKDDDIYGNAVNIAARIEGLCAPGGVLISGDAYEKVKQREDFAFANIGVAQLHNIGTPVELFGLTNHDLPVPNEKEIKRKTSEGKKSTSKFLYPLIGGLVLLLTAFFIYNQFFNKNKIHIVSAKEEVQTNVQAIAVLPFLDMEEDDQNRYFTVGMHDDLLTFLSKSNRLKVISRSSVAQLKDTDRTIKEIADLLGVTHVMEGSVRRMNNQVRINVQLIEASTDNNLWAETYDRELSAQNIFEIQSDIASRISASLLQSVFDTVDPEGPEQYTDNFQAYENYLRARQLKESGVAASLYEAKELLEEAIALDDQFAEAYILLANLHIHLVYYAGEDPDEFFPRGWDIMEEGMTLDPNLSEAYALKGSFFHWWKREFEGAKEAYERAIALNPNNDNAYYGLAIAYQDLNMNFEIISELLQKALSVNPLNPNLINTSAIYQRENQDLQGAIATFKKGIEIAPAHPNLWGNYAGTYYYKSRVDSVAIISHQCVEQNGREGTYLRNYLEALTGLSAMSELESELENISDEEGQEAIIKYNFWREFHLKKRDFDQARSMTEKLSQYNSRWPDITSYSLEDEYYTGNWEAFVDGYEDAYKERELSSFSVNDLTIAVQYVYALFQLSRDDEGAELMTQIEQTHLQNLDSKALRYFNRLSFNYVGACISALKGDNESAINQIENYLGKGSNYKIHWVEMEPIFNSLNDDVRYQDVLRSCRVDMSKQLDQYRSYLGAKFQ